MPEKGPTVKCIVVAVTAVLAAVIAIIASSFSDVGYSEVCSHFLHWLLVLR